jgi:tripartite-type tricarboxylate transporter receptor subunit TctC
MTTQFRHPEVAAKRPSKEARPKRLGRRPSRLGASRRAPQDDGVWCRAILFSCLLLAFDSAAHAEDAASYFTGKTLRIIVGLPPGGAADAYARLVQRHLPAHLPGAPPIIVENVPGAGTAKSVAYMETLPPDGTAIVTFSSGLLTEAITAPERVKIDFRQQGFVGNVSEDARVCYLWHTTGVRDWADFLARQQVVFAASAPGTAGYVDAAMLRDLFGAHLRQINGYPGSAEMRLAVEKGEVDGSCGGWTAMPEDWLHAAKVNVVVRLSPTLLPGMDKSVPFAGDLVKDARERAIFNFLMAPEKLGRPFMVSGRVPPERLALLRLGFAATVADPAFVADAENLRLTVTSMNGEEVARDVAALYATPADLVAKAKIIAGE